MIRVECSIAAGRGSQCRSTFVSHIWMMMLQSFQRNTCVSVTKYLSLWNDESTCDDSIDPDLYIPLESSDGFTCDAGPCDYVGVEWWPGDYTSETCTDGVAPTDVPPLFIPLITGSCISTDTYGDQSMFTSDCDSSGNIVYQVFSELDCAGTPNLLFTISSTGNCVPENDMFAQNLECSIMTVSTTEMATSDDDYDESSDSDSSEEVFYAVANDRGGLLEEQEKHTEDDPHYTINVKISDVTLMHLYGLFGVLVFVNVLFWFVCHRRKTKQNNETQLRDVDVL
eukprot:1111354_1